MMQKFSLLIAILFFLSFKTNINHPDTPVENHNMIYWAELLVKNISSQNTDYRHKNGSVTWTGSNGSVTYESYADCSGLINALIKQTYSVDDDYFKTWLGKKRPLAYNYYDAIASENHFKMIGNVRDVQAGDMVVLKYNDRSDHEDNTGHCMLVTIAPSRCRSSALFEPDTEQYELTVIDSSKSPHGKSDTRRLADGTEYAGLGKGVFRLYADKKGNIKGYSWSTSTPKPGFDPFANRVIVGRIDKINKSMGQ